MATLTGLPASQNGSQQRVHTSATVLLSLKGVVIGAGTSANATERYNVQAISQGIGSIMPLEHAITEWSANISIERIYVREASLRELGIAASGVGILANEPINIAFLDSLSKNDNKSILTFVDCTMVERDVRVSQNQAVTESTQWVALNVQDTSPDGYLGEVLKF